MRLLPESLREPAMLWLDRFLEQHSLGIEFFAPLTGAAELQSVLLRLAACSEYAGNTLIREWQWIANAIENGEFERRPEAAFILPDAGAGGPADENVGQFKSRLRRFRNQRMLQVLWRDLAGQADVSETLTSLSNLADSLIEASVCYSERELRQRFGVPRDPNAHELRLIILAMGKLGGRELNFSSDVDLIFVYPGDGETDGARSLSAQEYFTRLSRQVVGLLDEVTPDGFVYRVDTRLRPFGDSGPPVVSFNALESYLVLHGRSWERYAYVKARVIETMGADKRAVEELTRNIIEPFVYRNYLDYGVFESLREMKALIAAEARKRQLASNIKLGPGGIREIEFIVQSLQLVRGGGDRKLKTTELQAALRQLALTRSLAAVAADGLGDAYRFLRRMENFMQAMRDQQTHEVPDHATDRARLALAMGYAEWDELAVELERQRRCVSEHFAAVVFRGGEEAPRSDLVDALAALWSASASEADWTEAFERDGFRQAPDVARTVAGFANSAAVGQLGKSGARRLDRFMPGLLVSLKDNEQPAIVLQRVLSIVERILRRSAYVALLNENPVVRNRLVGLCDRNAWLAEEIGRYPLLLDELLDARLHTAGLTREEMQEELERRFEGPSETDSERHIEILAQFQRATLFRIAVADVTGNLPIMKVSDRLTELAEIILQKALAIALDDMTRKHGRPQVRTERGLRTAGFGVIAYGKFGGMELSYRSDLDLVFLHDSSGSEQQTDGAKPLENSMFFARLVRRLVHFLTAPTASGALYQVDTRLRPSGKSGLLVTSVEAFERYQEENAWTWEHQALLRSRPVSGSAVIAREFERVRAETLKLRVRRDRLQDDVKSMRRRMRSQLDKSEPGGFDLKQGIGGIADIEFIVQFLVLQNANRHPAVIHYPDNIRQLGTLAAAGCLSASQVARLQEIYKSYRLRVHRLALDEKPPLASDTEFADERALVTELWDAVLG